MLLSKEIVIEKAKAAGFDLIGFAQAEELVKESEELQHWLSSGYNAGMQYMERNFEKRRSPNQILPDVKSVISLALNYYTNEQHKNKESHGKISRYAWGKDYHLIIWDKLERLQSELKRVDGGFEGKSYVDTGPVMDKAWAVRSGIGWMGKNTNIINKEIGSWFFIANIFTNRIFEYSEPVTDHCGSCTACIDECPTHAIVDPYIVDANKCISYLTIENKKEISEEFKGKFENWIFGCDICQDVCPWNNKFAKTTNEPGFFPSKENELNINKVLEMTEEDFNEIFKESPVLRAKLKGLKRNAAFIKEEK